MKDNALIREYNSHDKEAVLNIFKLNTPKYFSLEEENEIVYYLENEIEQYFVVEIDGKVVGSGGINFSKGKTTGIISWDILHPDFQGKSLGSLLLNYRLKKLKQFEEIQKITVRTSQLSYKFYQKLGFKLIEIVEDYWAKGYHLYSMEYAE